MSDSLKPITTPSERVVRIYIASLLPDMHRERDLLETKIFPELRRLCRKRFVEFVAVHAEPIVLGPRADQSEILSLCLSEIEKCRPYFVGLLGQSYGPVPDTLDPELMAKHLWLVEHLDKSVLELQILHATLNDPSSSQDSFFYFRDEGRASSPAAAGAPEAQMDDDDSPTKLEDLKERIRATGLPLRENCPDPDTLARFVLEDIWAAIDRTFPAAESPDRLTRLAGEHEAFGRSRTAAWVPRDEYCRVLDEHVQGSHGPLVVSGDPGVGKAALLVNWAERYRRAHPDRTVIVHFMDGTPRRSDPCAMMIRVMADIKRGRGVEEALPDSCEKVTEQFPSWLHKAASSGPAVLVLHGLDQIATEDERVPLDWPWLESPSGFRVILSAAPGPVLTKLEQLGGARLNVGGLRPHERHEAIVQFLGLRCWPLVQHQVERIAQADQTANPLYLRLLLEELRDCSQAAANPEELVSTYLEAQTIPELYERILGRWERDHGQHLPNLVGNVLTLLWASRSGLYESEILELLNELGHQPAFEIWTRFFSALSPFLVSSSGLLTFFHPSFRNAVEKRYLQTPASVQARHLRLALYFLHCRTEDRKIEELPWQLKEAQAWESLKNTFTDPSVFRRLFAEPRRCHLTDYWLSLCERYDMPQAFEEAAARYEKSGPSARRLAAIFVRMADFLNSKSATEGAEKLYRSALCGLEQLPGQGDLETAAALDKLVALLLRKGQSEAAEPLHRRALEIRQRVLGPDHPDVSTAVHEFKTLFEGQTPR